MINYILIEIVKKKLKNLKLDLESNFFKYVERCQITDILSYFFRILEQHM